MSTPTMQSNTTAPSNQGNITFAINERVLCYHGPLVYEAKVLKTQTFDETTTVTGATGVHYFVHYKGWKQTWDEWVPYSRLLKINEENLARQKALQAQHASTSHAAGGMASSASAKVQKSGAGAKGDGGGGSTRTGGRKDGRGTKRGREEDDSNRKPDIKLNIPEILKVKLVDDWEAVTKNNQVVKLPREPSVADVLHEFSDYVLKSRPPTLRDPNLVLPTIISGLQCYFDRALGANLLYRFERLQYAEVRKQYWTGQKVIVGQEKEMSFVYGAEHLLRMIVSLPQMIASSSLDQESVALVRDYVNELLQFLAKERDRFFLPEYDSASPAYQNIVRS